MTAGELWDLWTDEVNRSVQNLRPGDNMLVSEFWEPGECRTQQSLLLQGQGEGQGGLGSDKCSGTQTITKK